MIFSLLKVLLFVAVVAGLAWGANQLMQMDGSVAIDIAGFSAQLSVLQLVIAAAVLLLLIWLAFKLLAFLVALFKFLNGDETAISRYFSRNRERRGFRALRDGMVALAAGEGAQALAKARKAEKLLNEPRLTNILTAQAAEVAGDRQAAEATYRRMLEDEETRFVGVRGIMKQKLVEGDTETAMKLAEKAFALKPKHVEVQDTLLQLQAEKGDWGGARKTLGAKLKSGALPRDVHKRRDAVLALSEARELVSEGGSVEMKEAAIEANRLSPDLIPAAVMAARSYIADSKPRYATRVVKKAWDAQPHPDLAAVFAEIVPEEDPQARIKRFQSLVRGTTDHAETKMLMAELNIAAEDFPAARRALGSLLEDAPTARSLTLMAAIERGEGADDQIVRGWLTKALSAPRGPQWVCEKCSSVQPAWSPTCPNCHSFDTLTWKTPASNEVAMPSSTEMLPLIVGPDAKQDALVPAEVEVMDAETSEDQTATPEDADVKS